MKRKNYDEKHESKHPGIHESSERKQRGMMENAKPQRNQMRSCISFHSPPEPEWLKPGGRSPRGWQQSRHLNQLLLFPKVYRQKAGQEAE